MVIDLISDGVLVEFLSRDSVCAAAGRLIAARDVPAIAMDLSTRRLVNNLLAVKCASALEIIGRVTEKVGRVTIH